MSAAPLSKVTPPIDATAFVHPMAMVDDTIIVGPRTKIWQFATVIRGTVLGADCTVASAATLDGPRFGDRCIVCQGVAMGPGFLFGNDCFVGPNVTLCNDMWPSAGKSGFDDAKLRHGDFWTIMVGDGTAIGANAVILPGVIIGEASVIAAGAVVGINVPAGYLYRRDNQVVRLSSRRRERMIEAGRC